ncbi:MAG TPA: helix-turn-helix domain-containing protein [Pyrinomonadaceae bacterium]|jgi:tetratricopeptide (TPR) repeat protein
MTLADERLRELDNPSITADDRASLRCRVAADLIHRGQYEAAREALGELWRGIGERPNVEELEESAAAEVLLQVGVLSGWLGASKHVEGAQGAAKDLISEGAALFEKLGKRDRTALARTDISFCYWREGAYSEARVMLEQAAALANDDAQLKAKIVLRFAIVEIGVGRYSEALHLLTDSASLFDSGVGHTLRGSFHNERARVLWRLGSAERNQDYFDRAIIEYTAAIYHAEQARHERYVARIENNLAFLLYKLGRYRDAHEHLDQAQAIFTRLRDAGSLAQVDETRARVLVAERRYKDAERILSGAIKTFERGDESALLADALTVQGIVWARLWAYGESVTVLRRAAELAESAGALSNAAQATLALIEEHGASRRLPPIEVYEAYVRADEFLKNSQDAEDKERLRACARVVMRRLSDTPIRDKNFSLYGAMQEYEAKLIGRALEESGGSITKAARLLGLTHQTLGSILNTRQRKLSAKRKPVLKRLKSIIKKPEK